MGFLSSLFGSSKSIRNAQQQAETQRLTGMNAALGALQQGADTAAGYINQNPNIYANAYNTGKDAINSGYGNAIGSISNVNNYLRPFYDTGTQANSAYADAMGFNGAEGSARSSQAFRSTPGYQAALDAGSDQIKRNAAATGGLATGNTLRSLQDAAINTSNQNYQSYLNNINTGVQTGLSAAQGMGQNDVAKASLYADQGNALAGLSTNYGNQLAGNNNSLAGLYSGLGDNQASLYQGTYNQLANDGISAANAIAQNRANGLSNLFSLGTGLLGLWSKR